MWIVFRKYLPVLKGFPAKYIHAPWTAPESVQKAARCIIGKDYPHPIVDHTKVSSANLEKMRNVFKALLCYKESRKSHLLCFMFSIFLVHLRWIFSRYVDTCPIGGFGLGWGALPIMDLTGRLRLKRVPFSGWGI